MKRSSILLLTAATGLCLFGCDHKTSKSETSTFDLPEAEKIIREKTNRFTEAHILKDTTYLNQIFSTDARCFPPNSDIVAGREVIAGLNWEWVNYGISEFTETSTRFYGSTDVLIDEGTYALRYGKENTIDRGKYINIWKRESGEWKICSNIWNTSLPAEAVK